LQSHLDGQLHILNRRQREIAAQLFSFLVTPPGARVAYNVRDLCSYTAFRTSEVTNVVEELVNARILRAVYKVESDFEPRYEISNDIIAHGILDWRSRRNEKELRVARRITRQAIAIAVILFVGLIAAMQIAEQNRKLAEQNRKLAQALEQLRVANQVASTQFSPGGRYLVVTSSTGVLNILDTSAKSVVRADLLPAVNYASFRPDGRLLITANKDQIVRLWEFPEIRLLTSLSGHTAAVRKAVSSPDGSLIATASDDHTCRVWDANTGRLIATFKSNGPVIDVRFSPDGKTITAVSAEGQVSFWDLPTGERFEVLKAF